MTSQHVHLHRRTFARAVLATVHRYCHEPRHEARLLGAWRPCAGQWRARGRVVRRPRRVPRRSITYDSRSDLTAQPATALFGAVGILGHLVFEATGDRG